MPRQTNERKNHVNLQPTQLASVERGVYADQNVRAHQVDTRPILQALSQIGGFAQQQAREKRAERDKLSELQGARDATLGEADLERLENDAAYAEGNQRQTKFNDGLELTNQKLHQLQELIKKDPNFDIQKWLKESSGEYLGNAKTEAELEMSTRMFNQFAQQALSHGERLKKVRQDELSEQEVYRSFQTAATTPGRLRTKDDFELLVNMAQGTGMSRDEAISIGSQALLLQVEGGNVELAKTLEHLRGESPELDKKLTAAIEHGERLNEVRENKRIAEEWKNNEALQFDLYTRMYENRLTPTFLDGLVQKGYIDGGQKAQWLARQNVEIAREAERAAKEAAKYKQHVEVFSLLQEGKLTKGNSDQKKAGREVLDTLWSEAAINYSTALRGGLNPRSAPDEYSHVKAAMDLHLRNGEIPAGFVSELASFDFQNSQHNRDTLLLARELYHNGYRDSFDTKMSADALLKLKMFDQAMLRNGENTDAALATLSLKPPVTEDVLQSEMRRVRSKILSEAKSLSDGDDRTYTPILSKLNEWTEANIRIGGLKPEAALEDAVSRIEKFADADETFLDQADDWVREVALPKLRKDKLISDLVDDDEVRILFEGDGSNAFYVSTGPYELALDKQGNPQKFYRSDVGIELGIHQIKQAEQNVKDAVERVKNPNFLRNMN